ncbi:hypothetical protein PBRA_009425, partial [Plasmodiophora brassicae]
PTDNRWSSSSSVVSCGYWSAWTPAPCLIHVLYRQRLHDIVRVESAVASIAIGRSPSHGRRAARVLVVTSDYRVWDVLVERKRGDDDRRAASPAVTVADRASCVGCCPGAQHCYSLPNGGIVVYGTASPTYLLSEGRIETVPSSPGRARIAVTLLAGASTSGTSSSMSCNAGGARPASARLRDCVTLRDDDDNEDVLLEGRVDGQVTWTTRRAHGVVCDMQEPVVGIHVVDDALLVVSSFGKILHLPTWTWIRIQDQVRQTVVQPPATVYFLDSQYRLRVADLSPTLSSSPVTCCRQCAPLVAQRSTLFDYAAGLADGLAARTFSNDVLFVNAANDKPVDLEAPRSLSATLRRIGQVSAAEANVLEASRVLDVRLHAGQVAIRLLQGPPGSLPACTLACRPMTSAGRRVLLDITLTNRSAMAIPGDAFMIDCIVKSHREAQTLTQTVSVPLERLGPAPASTTSVACCDRHDDSPIDVRIYVRLRSHSTYRDRQVPMVQILQQTIDVGDLARLSAAGIAGSLACMSTDRNALWIQSRLNAPADLPPPSPAPATMTSCRIAVIHSGSTSKSSLLDRLVTNGTTNRSSVPGSTAVLTLRPGSAAQLTVAAYDDTPIASVVVHCPDAQLLPLWRACIVRRLMELEDTGECPSVPTWTSVMVDDALPKASEAVQTFQERAADLRLQVDELANVESGLAGTVMSSVEWSRAGARVIREALAAYADLRTHVSVAIPFAVSPCN